ncbi:short chain dehydrogenase domain-containing protein [Ditylenchus destructor]|nr:short chain dehydrogenase domain-containing protein [Ditylenchus destructor]
MHNTGKFLGKTVVISGASRGIGKEIGLKLAKDGANIVICAKTTEPHPKLPGTIYTAAEEMEKAGGKALACMVDIRDEKSVQDAVEAAVKKFGGVDILVNNASAISLTGTLETPMKRYDLMHGVNVRGTFMMSQKCIPYLKQAKNPHILNLSPPLLMEPRWFSHHVAYTMAKFGMSMCVLGMHEELRPDGIAVNALWPKTAIWTSAMEMLTGGQSKDQCRKPSIVADAAYAMLSRNSRGYTGNFAIDEDVLKKEGVTNFDQYAYDPNVALMPDAFIPDVDFNVFAGKHDQPREKSRESIKAADIDAVIAQIQKVLNPEVVQKVGAVYEFILKDGSNVANIYMDLKNGSGSMQKGKSPAESDVQFVLSSADFVDMFRGKFSPTTAFMQKKLNIKGNMQKAVLLEGVMRKMVPKESKV